MSIVKSHQFWIGVLAGYLFVVLFPQFNVRLMGVKASVGRA